jgi:MFS transporter, PAT family, beta-lactamase induction signal transducer AmpG
MKFLKKDYTWAFTTYFTEGFPYTVIRTISSVFFRDMKVSLESIGLTSLFGLPWILKFLWAPVLDQVETKRKWLLLTQGLLAIIILLASIFATKNGIQIIVVLLFIGAIIAATHDTSIDGYYMEALDSEGQAKFLGYRVMAYRIAMMTGTGVVVTIGTTFSWVVAFFVSGLIMGIFFIFHFFYLKEVEKPQKSFKWLFKSLLNIKPLIYVSIVGLIIFSIRYLYTSKHYGNLKTSYPILKKIYFSHWIAVLLLLSLVLLALFRNKIKKALFKNPDSKYSRAFISFVDKKGIGIILVFIIFLRAGEFMLTTMVSPFIVDLGIKIHYGWISAGVGLPASIAGALLGGWIISRYSMKKVIFPFILFQNLTNIMYMMLAFYLAKHVSMNTGMENPASIGKFNIFLVALVHAIEQFSGGLGTAVLMTYLMKLCSKEFKAAHYAIGSGLMAVSGLFAGVSSGFLASWFGYGWMFFASFLIATPALIAIPFLPLDFNSSTPGLENK